MNFTYTIPSPGNPVTVYQSLKTDGVLTLGPSMSQTVFIVTIAARAIDAGLYGYSGSAPFTPAYFNMRTGGGGGADELRFMMRANNLQAADVNDGIMPATWNYWTSEYGNGPYMVLRQNYGTIWNTNVAFGNGNLNKLEFGRITVPNNTLPAYYYIGKIAEFICYNRALTDNEKLAVSNYLAAKWAI